MFKHYKSPLRELSKKDLTYLQRFFKISESQITDLQNYLLDAPVDGNDYVRNNGSWVMASPGGVTDHGALTGLNDDDHPQYHTDDRALIWLKLQTTDNLPQGVINLYFPGFSDLNTDYGFIDNSGAWDTAFGWGDHSTQGYLTSFTETNDLTSSVTWANVPDANVTQTSVTQHESALIITESQISDFGSYYLASNPNGYTADQTSIVGILGIKAEFNTSLIDGSFMFIGDAPTAHTHVESDITDLQAYLLNINSESITELSDVFTSMTPIDGQVLTYDTTNGWQAETPASGVTDHTLLSNIGTNTHAQIDTHIADTTTHFTQGSISITESQISDLGTYSTDIHANIAALDLVSGINTGDQTSIVGITGLKTQFDTALTDGNFMYAGDAPTAHTHTASEITDFDTEVSNNTSVAANTAKVTNATHTGDVTGATVLTIGTGVVDLPMLSATGTANATTYLRGDNTWATVTGGSSDHGALTGLADDDHTQYHTDGRALTWLGTRTSDDLPEGATNLYFPGFTSLLSDYSFTDNSANWNTAFSWGDHSTQNYALTTGDTFTGTLNVTGSFSAVAQGSNSALLSTIGTGNVIIDTYGTGDIFIDNFAFTATKAGNWDTAFGWGDHSVEGYLTSFTETNDLTAAVTWANVPNANITQASVTQHEAALSITESQISDLGTYLTDAPSDGSTYGRNNGSWVISGGATASDMPIVRLRSSAAQSADSTSDIAVQWNQSEVKDAGFTHSTITNNSRITVDATGNYHLSGAIVYTGSTGNYRFTAEVSIRINGTTTLSSTFKGGYIRATSGANENQVPFTLALNLTAGDYIEILSKRINTTSGNATIEASTNVSMVQLKGTKGDTGADGADGTFDINGLTVENSIDAANDTIGFYDNSAGTNRKTAIANIQGTQVYSGTTSVSFSSGVGSITHGLGFTPTTVVLTLLSGSSTVFNYIHLGSVTSTLINVRLGSEAGIGQGGTFTIHWIAIE